MLFKAHWLWAGPVSGEGTEIYQGFSAWEVFVTIKDVRVWGFCECREAAWCNFAFSCCFLTKLHSSRAVCFFIKKSVRWIWSPLFIIGDMLRASASWSVPRPEKKNVNLTTFSPLLMKRQHAARMQETFKLHDTRVWSGFWGMMGMCG